MPLRPDLLAPIAGDNPSGANVRYDPVYDQIKEARRQDDLGPQGDWQRERKVADYRQVVDLASKVIAERSKDLQLAVWLAEASLHREKFAGLREGLDLVRGILDQFWDTFYPEIEDDDLEPRVVLLGWVGERLVEPVRFTPITSGGLSLHHYQVSRIVGTEEEAAENDTKQEARQKAVAEGKPTVEDFDRDAASTSTAQYESWIAAMDACLASIESLGTLCDEKFGNDAPSFVPLRTAVEEVRHTANMILSRRNPKPIEEEPQAEPQVSYEPPAPAEPKKYSEPQTSRAATVTERVDDIPSRLNAVAKFLRAQDASNPAPYLLLRGYRWGDLRGQSDPSSQLVPPPTAIRQAIRRLASEGDWAELIETAETAMAQPFAAAWLDLQRHVVNAAEQNGYAHVAAAIRSEIRTLLADLPSLPTWEFSDETPVASADTHAWLKELAAPTPPALPPPAVVFDDEEDTVQLDTFDLALEAARAGRDSEAIQMIASQIQSQPSGRARFQRKLQLAQICIMTGHATLAQPILQELVQAIDHHQLDEWESRELIAQPLVLLYKLQRDEKLYARISRLDPVQALECER